MKKEIRKVSKDGKSVQITTVDERWYTKEIDNTIETYPSITWIVGSYPKGVEFYKWLASKGWNEAEAIKEDAGRSGSKVHSMVEALIKGHKIKIDDTIENENGQEEEIKIQEYEAVMSFADWFNEVKPKTIFTEQTIFNTKDKYAGTVDYLCKIEGELWMIDFKTSNYIWPSHHLQLSAYKEALRLEMPKYEVKHLAILQLGYKRNKRRYKLTEIDDNYPLFLSTKRIWENQNKNVSVFQADYPTELKLNIKLK